MTRSQTKAAELSAKLRARNPLIIVRTREEHRVEPWLFEAAAKAGYIPRTWDVASGIRNMDGTPFRTRPDDQSLTRSIDAALDIIADSARDMAATKEAPRRFCWVLRDATPWLMGVPGAQPTRQLRNLCRMFPLPPRAQPVIILTPSTELPPELAGHATIIDWPLPDREEIAAILDTAISNLPAELQETAAPNGQRDAAIDAALGLAGYEAENCYSDSIVRLRKVDPVSVNAEKKRIISASKILEVMDYLEGGFEAVGGLDAIKSWVGLRKLAYGLKARAYGVPMPKGMVIVGISGCGKNSTAKAIAWQLGKLPLFRFDLGAMKSKYVGDSEAKIRRALDTIDTAGPCVVLVDEMEKAFAGASQGAADGGVSADAMGTFLTWMQERKGQAFIVATCNDVSGLPPEMLRKGRWDELFWCDLPTVGERVAILDATLTLYKRVMDDPSVQKVAKMTEGFSGAELAALVPDALFTAFADGERDLNVRDLLAAASSVKPLSETAKEKITKMREWSVGRARPASTPVEATESKTATGRTLDI